MSDDFYALILVDRGMLVEILEFSDVTFLRSLVAILERVAPGLLDQLDEAREVGDYPRLRKTVHKLRSSASSLGCTRMSDLATRIEIASDSDLDQHAAEMLQVMRATYIQTLPELRRTLDGL